NADAARPGTSAQAPGGAALAAAIAKKDGTPEKAAPAPDNLLAAQSAAAGQRTDTSLAVKPALAQYQNTPTLNMPQIAFEMASQFKSGNSRFQIRLDPPEMGRIDVRMDIDAAGN